MGQFEIFNGIGAALALSLSRYYAAGQGGLNIYSALGGLGVASMSYIQENVPASVRKFMADNMADWDESTLLNGLIGALAYDLSVDGSVGMNDLSIAGAGRYYIGAISAAAGMAFGKWLKGKFQPAEAAASPPAL